MVMRLFRVQVAAGALSECQSVLKGTVTALTAVTPVTLTARPESPIFTHTIMKSSITCHNL